MEIADVSREICVVPDEFPVVVATMAVEPLVLPVDEEKNSQVEDGPEMLSGRVMDTGDPDVECSTQVLLEVVPFVGGDGLRQNLTIA